MGINVKNNILWKVEYKIVHPFDLLLLSPSLTLVGHVFLSGTCNN
jgi:hypothetical protein